MITVNDSGAVALLGRAGEYDFREVRVDASCWVANYPDCQITAVFQRPDGVTYQIPLKQEEGILTWKPTETDTYPGWGLLELRVRYDSSLGKSATIKTICERSIQHPVSAEPPTDLPPGAEVDQVLVWSLDGAIWRDPSKIADEVIRQAVEAYDAVIAPDADAVAVLAECGVITPAAEGNVLFTDAGGKIYVI